MRDATCIVEPLIVHTLNWIAESAIHEELMIWNTPSIAIDFRKILAKTPRAHPFEIVEISSKVGMGYERFGGCTWRFRKPPVNFQLLRR